MMFSCFVLFFFGGGSGGGGGIRHFTQMVSTEDSYREVSEVFPDMLRVKIP